MSIKFADLNLDKNILSAVSSEGYESPTPIQAQAIPFALDGRDIMASAQTGSGKTAAFLLPTLQKLTKRSEKPGKGPRALVLTPTRELAAQVEKNALAYAKNMRWFRTVSIVGGASFGYQTRALSKPVDLIVATPGRLMDLMQSGKVDFERFGSADSGRSRPYAGHGLYRRYRNHRGSDAERPSDFVVLRHLGRRSG